jgi:flagellar assembly factor FliW
MNDTRAASHEQPMDGGSARIAMPIKPENVFHFPEGLPAFEEAKDFVFLCKPETSPFIFMRAIEPLDLGFVCVDPFLICPEYKPRINDADTAFLGLNSPDEVLLLSIVTVNKDVRKTTANLQGPLAINLRTCKGKQIICDGQGYPVRYGMWEALGRLAEREQQSRDEELEANQTAAA